MGPDLMTETTRLFVGGLPHDISPERIAQRFQSFGTVQSVELVPEKAGSVYAGPTLKHCRGFAFVQFCPKDDTALHRCISMYNGCKWMGGVLRVEPASMHYKARLAKEEVDELLRKQPMEQDQAHVRLQPGDDGLHERPREDAAPLTILRRDGKKTMRAVPNRAKTYFPPVKQPRTGDLSWGPVEPPPGAVTKEQVSTLLAKIPSSAVTRNLQAQVTPLALRTEKKESTSVNEHAQEAMHQQKSIVVEEQEQRQESSESEELGAVDFMSDSDDEQRPPVVLDSRFDSSSDDEEAAPLRTSAHAVAAAALKASALQPSGSEKHLGVAKQQAEAPSKCAAQATEPDQSHSSTGQPGGVSKQMVEAHPERAARMAEMRGVGESDSSDGEDEVDAHAGVKPPAVHPEQADSSDGEEGSELAAAGILSPAQGEEADSREVSMSKEVGGSSAHSSSEDVRESSSDTGSSAGKGASSSPSEQRSDENSEEHPIRGGCAEEGPVGGQKQDPEDEVTGAGMQQSDSEQDGKDSEGESLGGEAGVSREYEQALNAQDGDIAAGDEPASDGGTDSDSEQAGSPLRAAPKEGEANRGEASTDVLSGLARVLPKGAAFCRLVGGTEVETAWRAARDALVADYKSKRRTALKQLPASKRGRYHA